MAESNFVPPPEVPAEPRTEPTLRRVMLDPKGVLQKNLKTAVYLGAALLVIAAAIFSSTTKKTPGQQVAAKGQPPQPILQDNTDNNVQDLKNQLKAEREKEQQQAATGGDPALASATPAQQAAAAAYGPTGVAAPCVPGQPCPQAGYGPAGYGQSGNAQPQLSPEQQQAQLIAAKERERTDESRFASNLVYSAVPQQSPQAQQQTTTSSSTQTSQRQDNTSLVPPRAAGESQTTESGYKRPMEADIDSAVGQPYLVYEGFRDRIRRPSAPDRGYFVGTPLAGRRFADCGHSHHARSPPPLRVFPRRLPRLCNRDSLDCKGGTRQHRTPRNHPR
jgi:type IV secretion system protein VirB10